ncbi:MAG TPA: metal ABC transporter permease [Steroidobacteraceae bacterium]|jgi:zinc/manganese transport system permease protein|nr:metal ABC transporter permease [Steroidobacteraceae bacterium]
MNDMLADFSILVPALVAGLLVAVSHVPLGQQVLSRGIVFIDLAVAQVAALGVIIASTFELPVEGWGAQIAAGTAALAGALLLTWTERKRPEVQEALIGILFVLASTAQILLLANNPHGGDNLRDLLVGQILWVSDAQLVRTAILTAVFALVWFTMRGRIGRIGFYVLFAIVVTASVQLVGVYLVFTTLIVPAVATYRHAPRRQLALGYALAAGSYIVGLGASVLTDLPSSPVIVWAMALLGLLLHLAGNKAIAPPHAGGHRPSDKGDADPG